MQENQTKEVTRILGRQVGREISVDEINAIAGAANVPMPTVVVTPVDMGSDQTTRWVY